MALDSDSHFPAVAAANCLVVVDVAFQSHSPSTQMTAYIAGHSLDHYVVLEADEQLATALEQEEMEHHYSPQDWQLVSPLVLPFVLHFLEGNASIRFNDL